MSAWSPPRICSFFILPTEKQTIQMGRKGSWMKSRLTKQTSWQVERYQAVCSPALRSAVRGDHCFMDLRSHTRVFRSLTLPTPRSLPHSFITPTPKNKMNGSAYLWPLDQKEDVDTGLPVSRMLFSYTVPKSQLESPPQVQQTYARLIPLSFLRCVCTAQQFSMKPKPMTVCQSSVLTLR